MVGDQKADGEEEFVSFFFQNFEIGENPLTKLSGIEILEQYLSLLVSCEPTIEDKELDLPLTTNDERKALHTFQGYYRVCVTNWKHAAIITVLLETLNAYLLHIKKPDLISFSKNQ